MNNKLHK